MSFQLWEFPDGQYGEGASMRDALHNAVGAAVLRGKIGTYDLKEGTYDITVLAVAERFQQESGLTILTGDLALYYTLPQARPPVLNNDRDEWWGFELALLPQEYAYAPVFYGSWLAERRACMWLYRLIRHVETTPTWTEWLRNMQT
jgi:hypothetical protein